MNKRRLSLFSRLELIISRLSPGYHPPRPSPCASHAGYHCNAHRTPALVAQAANSTISNTALRRQGVQADNLYPVDTRHGEGPEEPPSLFDYRSDAALISYDAISASPFARESARSMYRFSRVNPRDHLLTPYSAGRWRDRDGERLERTATFEEGQNPNRKIRANASTALA